MRRFAFVLFAVLFVAPVVVHADGNNAPVVNNMSVREFLKFHDDLDKKLDRKEYARVSSSDRATIAKAQATIRQTLAGKTEMSELSEIDRVAVFNAHERVVAAWEGAEDERLICRRERKVGSNRMETVCTTVAEQRSERDGARSEMKRVRKCAAGPDCG